MEQKDIVEFQMLSSEVEQVQNFLRSIDEQMSHVNKLVEDLQVFANHEPGTEVLFPIANGLFVKGTITDVEKLHVNVGQGVVVPRSIAQTQQLIQEQAENLSQQQVAAAEHQSILYQKLEALEKRVDKNV